MSTTNRYIEVARFPVAWLTLIGFKYSDGRHAADVIETYLLGDPAHKNPQLHDRVRDTINHVINRAHLEHRV